MGNTTQNQKALQPVAPLSQDEKAPFYNVPDSTASNLILETLGAGAAVALLPESKKKYNHSTTLEVLEDGKKRKIVSTSPKAKITLEFSDIEKFTGSNKSAKKFFVLALIKANEQAIFGGILRREYVSFPLQELVDIGFYKNIRSARAGFYSAMDALSDIKLSGDVQQTKKKKLTIVGLHPFRYGKIKDNQCFIFLESEFNWSFIAQYFTILPRYYFKLPNRASDLLYYVFYLARQHTGTNDIKEEEDPETGKKQMVVSFNISFRAIQHRLQLPSEAGSPNPQRDIKQPIEDAIEQIEDGHSELYGNTEFRLLPVYDDAARIADFLDNGYLKVTMTGDFAKTFIAISIATAKQVEAAKKRQARIMEKATAINTAKKMEAKKRSGAK